MDNNGNAIIVWQQSDGLKSQIFMSEYRNGSWTHPADLNTNISPGGQDATDPQVVMDGNGNAIIVWLQSDGTNEQVFMSEYRNGSWTHPSNLSDNISPDAQDALCPQVGMDDNGNALIVWQQSDGSNNQIFVSEYRNGSWRHPLDLIDNISPDTEHAYDPQVVMNNNGDAIIVWWQSDSRGRQIFKSEYRNGSWIHPADLSDNISPDDDEGAYDPQLAMDDSGDALIVWRQWDGTSWQIMKSEYRNGNWSHPVDTGDNISPNTMWAYAPQVAMDNNGTAIIVWRQLDGTNDQIFISEYRMGQWFHPSGLSDNISADNQNAFIPQVAMDNNGNAVIVWYQSDSVNQQIFMSEFR